MLAGGTLRVTHAAGRLDQPGDWKVTEGFDLAVCGFLLGELDPAVRDTVVLEMAGAAPVVAIIEPGTPAGYRRVLAARTVLIAAGRALLVPCPHDEDCPLQATQDWCHFAARLRRSVAHRQTKRGVLGYEDKKYSYVVAANRPSPARHGRILRHPQIRGGHVRVTVCSTQTGIEQQIVGKRHGELYRAARNARWGDPWPPPEAVAR